MKPTTLFSMLCAAIFFGAFFTLPMQVDALAKPTNLTVTDRTVSKATLKWKKIKKAKFYSLVVAEKNGSIIRNYNYLKKKKKTLKGLSPNKGYLFRVQACTSVKKCSSLSKVKRFRTKPKPPTSVSVVAQSRKAELTWPAVARSAQLSQYYVELLDADSNAVATAEVTEGLDADELSYEFHQLTPGVDYTARVRALFSDATKSKFTTETVDMIDISYTPQDYAIYDTHGHTTITDDDASAEELIAIFDEWNIQKYITMSPPRPLHQSTSGASTGDDLYEYFEDYTDRVYVMYGGYRLNPILNALGGENENTFDWYYPNGASSSGFDYESAIEQMQEIAADPTTWSGRFKSRATTAAESGKYVGFGEFAALHYSLRKDHPYQSFPIDHDLMKWLVNLAEVHNMVVDIHFETTDEKLEQLSNLLDYNTNTIVIWDHIGWHNTDIEGLIDAASAKLDAHPNLYMNMKIREDDSDEQMAASPLDENGVIREEWKTFFETYADRIMLGSDAKIWKTGSSLTDKMYSDVEVMQQVLDQLTQEAAEKIYYQNAQTVFGFE